MTNIDDLDANARRPATPPEVWDDDFEFQQGVMKSDRLNNSSRHRSDRAHGNEDITQRPQRVVSGENAYGKETGPSKRPLGVEVTTADHLRAWSESPISSKARGKLPVGAEENWDDDFVDKMDSPVRATHRRSISVPLSQENWDEDFEMSVDASPSSKRSRNDASWDSSDEEDLDRNFGFGRDEEDKTVTQKSRRRPLGALNTDIPPVPPLPTYLPTVPSDALPSDPTPFPRSPTMSVFSIPTTVSGERDSVSGNYGSTIHLRRTYSAGSSDPSHGHHQNIVGRFPPVSPSRGTRERRRLRKKSRPPHLENNIIELDDRAELTPVTDAPVGPYAHMPFRPVTPENRKRVGTPPSATSAPTQTQASSSSSSVALDSSPAPPPAPPTTSPPSKSPLLTRLGSVKRWSAGARKKRASTGPSEVTASGTPSSFTATVEEERHDNNKTPRPHSSYIHSSSSPAPAVPGNRFFRDISGSSGYREEQEQSPAKSRLSASSEASREQDLKKGKARPVLQVATGEATETPLASPRKLRIKALGSRLLHSSPKPHSPECSDDKKDADGDTRMLSPTHPLAPSSAEVPQTPTRHRTRLPPQSPSILHSNRPTIFPRHVSASAAPDSQTVAPSPSARSVSTSVMQDKHDVLGETPEKKEGSRGFMGSMRRISLVGGQKRHKRGKSGGCADDMIVETTPSVPDVVPPLPEAIGMMYGVDKESGSKPTGQGLLPALELGPPLLTAEISKTETAKVTISASLSVDIGSPVEKPLAIAPLPRRPGEPTLSHSKSSSFATPPPSRSSQNPMARLSASPSQAASLGRASQNPTSASGTSSSNVHRRNSLGDLKIPSRISRAQDGLKRDLTRVREFAAHVETMKDLRSNYYTFATQVQTMLEAPQPPSRTTSPTAFFNFSRPISRARSNTNPPPPPRINYSLLALSFRTIDTKYRIAWECAELLIDLGTGATTGMPPEASPPAPSLPASKSDPGSVRVKNRERAVTLAGDEGKPVLPGIDSKTKSPLPAAPPVLLSWRASTGRHDLNQRQLFLLKEMLNNAESAKEGVNLDIPEHLQWRLGEGMESNLTLPTEESAADSNTSQKKRHSSKLGMTGIRDMLRSLKRHHQRANHPEAGHSSTTLSTESSLNTQMRNYENHPYLSQAGLPMPPRWSGRRRSKTSAVPDSVRSTNGDYPRYPHMSGISLTHKSSPRRPSLASLFRLGQKHKDSPSNSTDYSLDKTADSGGSKQQGSELSHSTTENEDDESDWDRMDSLSDVDIQVDGVPEDAEPKGTLKLRKKKRLSARSGSPSRLRPATFKNPFSSSQASLPGAPDSTQVQILSTRLSNVDENSVSIPRSGRQTPADPSPGRPSSRGKDRHVTTSVRSVPLKPTNGIPVFDIPPIPEFKLAMTPENIKPLLENARVVTARLHDCVSEVKDLLSKAEVPS